MERGQRGQEVLALKMEEEDRSHRMQVPLEAGMGRATDCPRRASSMNTSQLIPILAQ